MKKLSSIALFFILIIIALPALASVLAYTVSVDQDTKIFFGSDQTNYTLIPSGTFRTLYVNEKTQAVFTQTSSAKTSTPNLRIEFMNAEVVSGKPPILSSDGGGSKIQGFRVDSVGNYYLTKSSTIPLN